MNRLIRISLGIFIIFIISAATISIVWSYNTVRKIEATVNDNIKIYLDNEQKVLTDTDGSKISPVIINGRTYLPLRSVASLVGFGVEWDGYNQSVLLSSDKAKITVPQENSSKTGELKFWHFDKDAGPKIVSAFNNTYPNIKIDLTVISEKDQEYQNKLTASIRSGSSAPDVFALESAFAKNFVDMPNACADLTERAKDYVNNMIPYTIQAGTDNNGALKALSNQGTPGALAYKKDVAKKYLGTDDPAKISDMMSTPEKMLKTAKTLKENSGGKVSLFPTFEEPLKMYIGGRKKGWVINDKLTIDQNMLDFIDFAKTLRNSNYDAGLDQWSDGWSSAIASNEKALMWVCPYWGIHWIVGSNDKSSFDGERWGLAKPTYPYFWGGTWFSINSKSDMQEDAWSFVKYITTDKDAMKKWANDNIDFPNNLEVLSEGSSEIDKIMGVDTFKFYNQFVKEIDGSTLTRYDDVIESEYTNYLRLYLEGNIKTKDDMLKAFKEKIKSTLGF
ncbi:MAG: extracellular solute-binding protein [Bacillota bacterium]|nr:extracellular solute-binding protein [Bacillota bacterium]